MNWKECITASFITIVIGAIVAAFMFSLISSRRELAIEKEKTRQLLIESAESGKSVIIFDGE